MSRTTRLFELIQQLRRHRYPVSGAKLAKDLGISLRTLYRDIASLQAQGAHIEGEPGVGYLLRPGFMLPPLMFLEEEIEALVLGSRWVARRADSQLSSAAKNALAKIAAVLPPDLRHQLTSSTLLVGPTETLDVKDADQILIRRAIRKELKLELSYTDVNNAQTQRIIWPLALGFFEQVQIIIAWCELRQALRHFRMDRIKKVKLIETRYPERRQTLLKKWREIHQIPDQY